MVVLESGNMLSAPGNQYLQPDYLPLPTTLDAKKSPLALLAQTCSQIGADSPSSKPLLSTLDKSKKSSDTSTRSSPGKDKNEKLSRSTPVETTKLAFKPYESTVLSKKSDDTRPSSKTGTPNSSSENKDDLVGTRGTPGRKSTSPATSAHGTTPVPSGESAHGKSSPSTHGGESATSSSSKSSSMSPGARGASPIIRSGLEVLQGHPKDMPLGTYKPGSLSSLGGGLGGGPLNSLCCPPGLEHPAFRPPYPGGPYSPHAAMLSAAGYHPSAAHGPFLSYTRVKNPSGTGEVLMPLCKDPYCTGCPFSVPNQHLMMSGAAAGPCPSGCTQCDHQKYNLAMAMSLVPGSVPSSGLGYPGLGRPYVCNWVIGDTYCGKRFNTPDELLQHLRTHTSASDAAAAAAVSSASAASSLLNSHALFSTAALHRAGYPPNPPLSPLSAARYHPYAKPSLPTTLGSPFSAFNPTLGPYYSAYSMYGQRIGAAVHP